MNFELIWADAALRGAAASLLVLHMLLAVGNGLRLPLRGVLAAFVMSILAYLWCSHPAFRTLSNPWWAIILSFCLMSAPLLWLLVRQVFDDGFQWTPAIWVGQALVLAAGWLAVLNVGGQVASHVASVAHKCLLIGFALATLWTTLRDWQSDLVATRRLLRTDRKSTRLNSSHSTLSRMPSSA